MIASGRTSPRQALVVLAPPLDARPNGRGADDDVRLAGLSRCLLLDVIGSLIGVNGATISVVCQTQPQARELAGYLPAGIDLLVTAADGPPVLTWALRTHLERAFSRVVAVAGDVVALPTRTAATALSSLVGADVIAGPSTNGGLYLIGVGDETGLAILTGMGVTAGLDDVAAAVLNERIRARGAVVRWLDERARAGNLADREAVRCAVAAAPGLSPRTAAYLGTDLPAPIPGTFHPPAVSE